MNLFPKKASDFAFFALFPVLLLTTLPSLCETSSTLRNSSHIFVHTLNGESFLVNRETGVVEWSMLLEPALRTTYNGGPILIADPLDGRLYEYSTSSADDIFAHLDHSIMGYVRRSPDYYKSYLCFGSKTDFWMSVDLKSGKILQASSPYYAHQCPVQIGSPTSPNSSESSSAFTTEDSLGFGQTQYNLLFRDPLTGMPKLNITYNTFASHTDLDLQNTDLKHIATTEPRLLTFRGKSLIWNLPLSSPVVGLYAVWNPNPTFQPNHCSLSSRTEEAVPTQSGECCNPNAGHDAVRTSVDSDRCDKVHLSTTRLPHILKRIAFSTYALDFSTTVPLVYSSFNAYFELKFNRTLDLSLCLLVNRTSTCPLYALPCVAESSLPLRHIRRAPDEFLLEGPSVPDNGLLPEPDTDWDRWSRSLVGMYELPWSQLTRWAVNNHVPVWARVSRWKQITDDSNRGAVIISPDLPAGIADESNEEIPGHAIKEMARRRTIHALVALVIACVIAAVFLTAGPRHLIAKFSVHRPPPPPLVSSVSTTTATSLNLAADGHSSYLPVHFDMPDSSGLAGCSAEEAGQPDAIRFNLNDVIGHGANGTMVFAGTFGPHQTAVKRIVRQPLLEKHWRREHAILLHLQHPNLVRCFWTGSTANFHYLVMQRCALSLAELLPSPSSSDPFSQWFLTPVRVVQQFTLAVAYLHHNRIVHRDLKPSNILIVSNASDTHVVVGDFGLSRPLPVGRHELTNSFHPQLMLNLAVQRSVKPCESSHGSAVAYKNRQNEISSLFDIPSGDQTSLGVAYGTLGWMAPEICDTESDQLTYAIDIFSSGLLAYYVLTLGRHPFDDPPAGASEQPCGSKENNSLGACGSGNSCHRSVKSTHSSDSSDPLHNNSSVRLSRHHARQLAIIEGRSPDYCHLFTGSLDLPTATIGRHLIESMLSNDPANRPSAQEVVSHPIFWPPGKVIRFISELSDLLDTREDESPDRIVDPKNVTTVKAGSTSLAKRLRLIAERRALLDDVEKSHHLVFNDHWFTRLEPDVVHDLLSTRGYQDTSLISLLRAIRNKRNHFWHLNEHIRSLLGHTQDGMTFYWTSRFPALVPLLYDLSRRHLTCGVSSMSEFFPNRPNVTQTSRDEIDHGDSTEWNSTSSSDDRHPQIPLTFVPGLFTHQSLNSTKASWERGAVLRSHSAKASSPQPEASQSTPTAQTDETVVPADASPEDETKSPDEYIVVKRRRRPNHAKKVATAQTETGSFAPRNRSWICIHLNAVFQAVVYWKP